MGAAQVSKLRDGRKEDPKTRQAAQSGKIVQSSTAASRLVCRGGGKMAKRKGSSTSQPRTRSRAAKEEREAREVENTLSLQRLDKLPEDVWEKVFDELDES